MKNLYEVTDSDGLVDLLVQQGYALYPSATLKNTSPETFCPLMNTFIELTNLLEEERKVWSIDADGNGDADDGLIERNGGPYDHKFFFHYKSAARILNTMRGEESYKKHRKKWNSFFLRLHDLHFKLSADMHDIVTGLDRICPEFGLLKKMEKQHPSVRGVLRLLYYKPGHNVTAKPHYDQSMFTFHVADSHPGLIVGQENERSGDIYISRGDDTLLLFPGMKAEIATQGAIQAARHSAIADDVTLRQGRWSIVFFFHCDVGMSSQEIAALSKKKLEDVQS